MVAFQISFRIRHQGFQENKEGLKLNRTHQLLVCADAVNLLGETMHEGSLSIQPR
jgi:hypothetical protein